MIIILFGAPGAGKGTQAQILSAKLGVAHLSTGDAFRAAIKGQTEVGLIAKRYVDAGDLVPDDVTARIVEEALAAPAFDAGAILDGFPRTQAQADALDEMLGHDGRAVSKVINLDVDDAMIVQRLLARGRADDSEEVIKNRLAVYRQETAPLMDFYASKGLLAQVDGTGVLEEINHRILDVISSIR